jgi:hypothetical protein
MQHAVAWCDVLQHDPNAKEEHSEGASAPVQQQPNSTKSHKPAVAIIRKLAS